MIIPINDKYRIATDRYQWKIEEVRRRKGKPEWNPILFYATFDRALKDLGELMVRQSDAETLAEALLDIENVCTTISQAFPMHLMEETTRRIREAGEEMRH